MSNTIQMPKPRTEAQRAAARANGAKSNGPTSEEGKAKSALNSLRHGLLAGTLVLRTESQPKFLAVLNGYLDDYQPEGQTENDLVEAIAAAKWQEQRCWTLITALVDIRMDRMEQEIVAEFTQMDNATRTALAFVKEADQSAGLALLNRYAARHCREWNRAIHTLRAIQKERREQSAAPTDHWPLDTDHCSLPNEPDPKVTLDSSTTSGSQPATSHESLATETDHRSELATGHWPLTTGGEATSEQSAAPTDHGPLATDHCISPNEPDPDLTPTPSTTSDSQPVTGHRPPATDRPSELATDHWPLTTGGEAPPVPPLPDPATPHNSPENEAIRTEDRIH
jgi:hypothetical protein